MFVRRLLVSAVLACLAACTTPSTTPYTVNQTPDLKQATKIGHTDALNYQLLPQRSAAPYSITNSISSASETALCLQQRLASEFKMPPEFIGHKVYTDNNHTVGLINPFTQSEGIIMDVVKKGSNSEIRLYDNGNLLSKAWKQLPNKCGQGQTTITGKAGNRLNPSKPSQPISNEGIDLVAANNGANVANVTQVSTYTTPSPMANRMIKPAEIASTAINSQGTHYATNTAVITPLEKTGAYASNTVSINQTPTPLTKISVTQSQIQDRSTALNTIPTLQTTVINTPSRALTQAVPEYTTHTEAIPNNQYSNASKNWQDGNLTSDDMAIIAPVGAAVFTPLMAKAVMNNHSNPTIKASALNAPNTRSATTADKSPETTKNKINKATVQSSNNNKISTRSMRPESIKAVEDARTRNTQTRKTSESSKNKGKVEVDDNKNSKITKTETNKKNTKSSKALMQEEKQNNLKNTSTKNRSANINQDNKAERSNKNNRKPNEELKDNKTTKNIKSKEESKVNNSKSNKNKIKENDTINKDKVSNNKAKSTDKKVENSKSSDKKGKK